MSQENSLFAPPTEAELQMAQQPEEDALFAPPTEQELAMLAPPAEKPTTYDATMKESLNRNLSGGHSDELAQNLQGDIGMLDAANTMDAASDFYGKENGWLHNAFYTLSVPEQFVARQAVNLIENMGEMTTDDAREILSRDEVHGSDIVNFYWRDPKTMWGKTGRFVTGLGVDLLLDPLSYLGIGALTKAGKAVTVASKTINLAKMSRAERAYYKTLQSVEKVLLEDGKLISGMDDAESIINNNMKLITGARDAQLSVAEMNNGIGMLQSGLNVSSESKDFLLSTIREGMTQKSWVDEWREGSRGLTFGARIPFTDMAIERDLPGPLSKLVEFPLAAVDGMFGLVKSTIRQSEWGDAAYRVLSDIGSNTGKFLFDVQQNVRLGSKSQLDATLAKMKTNARAQLIAMKSAMGEEKFAVAFDDILAELEKPIVNSDEALRLAEVFGKSADEAEALVQRSTTNEALARKARLEQNPALMDMIDDMKQMQDHMAQEFKKRNMPFEELNPFGENWATGYAKHVFTTEYIDKVRATKEASGAVEQAMKDFPQMMGRADQSSKGRKFRAAAQDINAENLLKDGPTGGVKVFVDDPIELVSLRMQEMHKVIQDHDLMEAASKYAVVGKNPGQGWVKFNHDEFKRFSQDTSDQFKTSWDSFVPNFFKQTDDRVGKVLNEAGELVEGKIRGAEIYLPEDVYARMDFAINGWKMETPLAKFLNAADVYTGLWRNNALFGAGYVGLNAFSNALTYLSLNDRGGPMALAKATMSILPETSAVGEIVRAVTPEVVGEKLVGAVAKIAEGARDRMMIKVPSLMKEITPQEALRWAHEDNLLNSSFVKGVEWSKMTEHVASNREARKILGHDPKNVVDHMFLWRYSRGTAQFMDDIPKMATYISYLEKGFSRHAAAEQAERLFYNFNKSSKAQAGFAKLVPFSSFPMKTAEAVLDIARDGKLSGLAIPAKVNAALDGAFVQDHDTRVALDQMLPGYKNVLHPIHGELMPGMREWVVDIPWTYATMNTIFHPERAEHPVSQILGLVGSLWDADEEGLAEGEKDRWNIYMQNLDMVIPSYMREAATLAEINGAMDFGGVFKDRYLPTMPTRSQIKRGESGRETLDEGTTYQKFTNAVEFGQALDKKYGENWLYNLVFNGRVDSDEGDITAQSQEAGARGEYLRRRFRQFTLGVASMNKLDSNFFMNTAAIKRQISLKTNRLKAEIVQSGVLMDSERLTDPQYLEKLQGQYPAAKEIMALHYKKDALVDYYDWFQEMNHKLPDLDLPSLLFGLKEHNFDFGDQPEKDVYQKLLKGKTMKNIPDEDAQDFIDDIESKESH